MNIANFFWHGPNLSLYEHACISSFLKNGFDVRVWSYRALSLPEGAITCDASIIMPEKDIERYTQGGVKSSLASFANFFRYKLLSQHGGWYFDTDVFCLSKNDAFTANHGFGFGLQDERIINNAALYLPSEFSARLFDSANKKALERKNSFYWGEVGPQLLTECAIEENVWHYAFPPAAFYPVSYTKAFLALDPEETESIREQCKTSLTYHIWNEVLKRNAIPKNILPPSGSFLHEKLIKTCPDFRHLPSLPRETLLRLAIPTENIGVKDHLGRAGKALLHGIKRRISRR